MALRLFQEHAAGAEERIRAAALLDLFCDPGGRGRLGQKFDFDVRWRDGCAGLRTRAAIFETTLTRTGATSSSAAGSTAFTARAAARATGATGSTTVAAGTAARATGTARTIAGLASGPTRTAGSATLTAGAAIGTIAAAAAAAGAVTAVFALALVIGVTRGGRLFFEPVGQKFEIKLRRRFAHRVALGNRGPRGWRAPISKRRKLGAEKTAFKVVALAAPQS
jgi:hypothetical protein